MERNNILDLLKFDLDELLFQKEDSRKIEVVNRNISYIDYSYTLPNPEFGVFQKAIVRIFSEERSFNTAVNTHLTFTTGEEPSISKMVEVIEALVNKYNADFAGKTSLTDKELEMLFLRDFWPGRSWDLNRQHKAWKMEDGEESFAYSVIVKYDSKEEGFSLSIFGYNRLVELFGN